MNGGKNINHSKIGENDRRGGAGGRETVRDREREREREVKINRNAE